MAKIQRGAVGAASLRGNRADENRPRIHIPTVTPKPAPQGKTVGYITDVARCLHVRIVARGEIEGMAELTQAVQVHHPEGVIKFENWEFKTTVPSVSRWIDTLIQKGILRGVYRDTQAMKVRCEFCDKTVPNTPKGMEEMAFHIMKDHDTPGDEVDLTDLSSFFGDLDAIGKQLDDIETEDGEGGEGDLVTVPEEGAQAG